jgi:hypothetical protein
MINCLFPVVLPEWLQHMCSVNKFLVYLFAWFTKKCKFAHAPHNQFQV